MSSPQLAEDAVQIVLLAKCRHSDLAAGVVARHFGLSRRRAEALLEDGRGVIAAHVPLADVREILPLFAALGVRVAIRPVDAEAEPDLYDLSLRSTTQKAANAALQELVRLGFGLGDFSGPSGLVLGSLYEARAKAVALALRSVVGIKVTVSAQSNAVHDLFVREPRADLTALRRHLSVLGCLNTGPASALATGLDQRTLTHLLARFPQLGLFGVNQAFQRYDLQLMGRGRLSTQELRDFLVTRGVCAALAGTVLQSDCGLTVERGLSRVAAGQFLSDYAAIGLSARAELV